jgi:antimicrobial peptide system SdpB family protein
VSKLTTFWRSLLTTAAGYDPRGASLAAGRCLLALATLSSVVFTPDTVLFSNAVSRSEGIACGGVRSASLWCLSHELTGTFLFARIVTITVLILAASGYRPKWTCVPHWYVTFSLTASMAAINGGDNAAVIATMLTVPLCLGDGRTWQWTRPSRPLAASWRGRSFATHLVIRLQVCFIYLMAAGSKVFDPAWGDGTAMYFVLHDPQFGLPASVAGSLAPLVDSRWLIGLLTWSVIAVQLVIAVAVLGRRRHRVVAVVLVASLHVAIIALMGLASFGTIMIALALIALGGRSRATPHPQEETVVAAARERQLV